MTLNANFAGARVISSKLEGPERGLDALVGLIILLAELLIGFLAISALFVFGEKYYNATSEQGAIDFGFGFVVVVSGIVFVITTIIYLVRMARGRRSWPATLWGLILVSLATVVGYFIMSSGV